MQAMVQLVERVLFSSTIKFKCWRGGREQTVSARHWWLDANPGKQLSPF